MKYRFGALGLMAVVWAGVVYGQGTTSGEPSNLEINYFQRFVLDGGIITWLILIPGSITTGSLVLQGFLTIRRSTFIPQDVRDEIQQLFQDRQFREVHDRTADEPSLLGQVIHAGLREASGGYAAMEQAMLEANDSHRTVLLRRIEFLNLIGNIAPMVGLFGTVFGMIEAFNAIVEVGGAPEPAKLAEGISIALVTTFWGLLVAIPALFFFAMFRNRIDALGEECWQVAEELMEALRPTGAQDSPGAARPPART